jgi:translation elongation factor EF-Tu-like GTPase
MTLQQYSKNKKRYDEIDSAPEEKARGITITQLTLNMRQKHDTMRT